MKTFFDIAVRARQLQEAGASPTRQWTLPLMCDHLAKAMVGSTGALGPSPSSKHTPLPRRIIGRIVVLTLGYIPKGVQSPERVVPRSDISWCDAIKNLDEAVALCQQKTQHGGPWLVHPLLGFSDGPTWLRFHLVHAKHHFSCLRTPPRPLATSP